MAMNSDQVTIITPRRGWFELGLWRTWLYRDLILLFALRDIKVRYKQTLLGPAWLLLQPLALMVVFTGVGRVAEISTDGRPAPLFYLAALVLWSYFSQIVLTSSQVFTVNNELFSKVYFPRIIVPVSSLLSSGFALLIQFALAMAFLVWYQWTGVLDSLSWRIALFPLVVVQLAAYAFAVGLILGASTAKYRDLSLMTPFLVQIWMFATPIIFPFSAIPESYRTLTGLLNPLAVIVEQGRWCFFGESSVDAAAILASMATTTVLLMAGILLFQRVERTAMDTV
jgi:lipopolysaccharide transport system permease protein